MSTRSAAPRGDSGWAVFAGVLFLLAGLFHAMWGIAALANDDNFATGALLFGDLSLWGVFYLALGTAQLAAAWLIGTGSRTGRWLGLVLASLSAVIAMASFGVHPLWSASIIIADLLVIYGLAVHGDDYA